MQVPPTSHQTWRDVVSGKRAFEPSFVAARMLIVRCRMQLMRSRSDADASRFAAELREVYAANSDCPSASRDLAALFP